MPKKRPARKRKPKPPQNVAVAPHPTRSTPDMEVVTSGNARSRVQKVAMFTATKRYRFAEEFFFWAGGLNLLSLGIVETLHRAGVRLGPDEKAHGFPYGVLLVGVVMVVPKLIGRMFAGRALVAIAGGQNGGSGVTQEQGVTSEQQAG